MQQLGNLFKKLLSPALFGILLTLLITGVAFQYYTNRDVITKNSNHGFLLKTLKIIDEKSVDLRLIARGPRPGSSNVALLTVDEKAVQTVGRWPWPRQITAKAIANAVEHGARVVAFDMVFSEPSNNPALEMFNKLKTHNGLNSTGIDVFQEELSKYDSDELFAQLIEKHGSQLVLGSFFENSLESAQFSNYEDMCHNLIYENSQAFQIWDNEEFLISYTDPFELYIPDSIKTIYTSHLNFIEETIREQTGKPSNAVEAADLEARVLMAQLKYCSNWLNSETDELYSALNESWPALKEQDEEIEAETFVEFVNNIRYRSLQNIMPQAASWVMNTPQISRGAKHTGYFNAQLDMDGTIRRSRLVTRTGNHFMPSIALKAFLVGMGYNAEISLVENLQNPGTKKIGKLTITNNENGEPEFEVPVDGEGLLKINYAGPQKMFSYFSLADLLTDSDEASVEQAIYNPQKERLEKISKVTVKKSEFLKDKFFILGASAIGIFDLRVTPFDENYPGAETHVNVLDNLLRRDFLYSHPDEETKMLVVLLCIGFVLSLALSKLGSVSGLLLTLGSIAGVMLFDRYFLFGKGIVVTIVFPMLLTGLLYVVLTFYKYFTEERNKKELRSTFQKYVSPAIVDEVLKNPKNIELGGRKENITVLFSDVRGFTTISEKLDPRALSDLLNSYLTPMTDLVFEHRGTLDKYMGDAVMAFFGAPIHYDDHPHHACRCALHMLRKLKELQIEYREKGLPEIDVGIGLNSGDCSVGNMGSQTVRSYTVMGDAVNLGSRLEGINKQYGTRIIISEFTYQRVKDQFVCREVDLVRVKGKVLPVRIYELIAESKTDPDNQKKLDFFTKGYELYHQKQFKASMDQFNNALNIDPEDKCSKLYIERCQNYLENPPSDDWDGVFVMTTK